MKKGTPEQLEAIKKDELSMNQVFNQIVEKRKGTKKEKKDEKATSKSVKKAAATPTKQKTEKTFEDGVRFAISQIKNGVTLDDLEKSLSA